MMVLIAFISIFTFIVFVIPWCIPGVMGDYGAYLTGVAAICAFLKYALPYILIFLYKKRYTNETIWKEFLRLSVPNNNSETSWVSGLISYFRRNESYNEIYLENRSMWYQHMPYLADIVSFDFVNRSLLGKVEKKLFDEIKKLFIECSHIVAIESSVDLPIKEDVDYQRLRREFSVFVKKCDEMNAKIKSVPLPVKYIIENNKFYQSLIYGRQ